MNVSWFEVTQMVTVTEPGEAAEGEKTGSLSLAGLRDAGHGLLHQLGEDVCSLVAPVLGWWG